VKRALWGLAVRGFDAVVRACGSPIRDHRTGELLGRGFLIPWRGKILVLGLRERVEPDFLPAPDIRYRIQWLGFVRPGPADFPRENA
jgi:hypothetical protein